MRVAVVTGGHSFDVPEFYKLFRELPGVDAYPQHLEHFASSSEAVRDAYDAVVFYGMERGEAPEVGAHYAGDAKAALEQIVERGQGIVILHHAVLAWEKWDFWDQVIGHDERNFRWKPELDLRVEVADKDHPVTQGTTDFDTIDEGYVLHGEHDGQSRILLTAEHKDIMKEVAWAREVGKCRVFVLTLGDNPEAWSNSGFCDVLERGILWTARGD
ncbi:ThuA domain-containing protein [Novipirellula artificiosorum]|uniref:Trehalose utilization n=1 Tax=Novipirellula artificiosorum TaxID=2528016 RepID=A0A5C6DWD5_9BACT|nr:ThuA domain-containing protein [Novipirellula artificiosorum]TWU40544.1 Trehalose utilization [Novipirellula artificiosorum]